MTKKIYLDGANYAKPMTKNQCMKLLMRLQQITLPEGSVPADKFAKNVYATPIGKQVIDTLNHYQINGEKLRKWGFITACISLSTLLK